jgi:hypothetical protein
MYRVSHILTKAHKRLPCMGIPDVTFFVSVCPSWNPKSSDLLDLLSLGPS